MAERSVFFSTQRQPNSPAASGDTEASPQTEKISNSRSRSSPQRPLAKRRFNRDKIKTATCGICLETVGDQGLLLRRLSSGMLTQSCAHSFCFTCVVTWAERTNTCPLCKERFNAVRRKLSNARPRGVWKTVEVAHKDPAEEVASGDEDLAAALEQGGDFDDGSDQEDPQEEVGDQTCTTGRHGYVIDDFIVSDASGNESLVEEDGEEEEEWETWEGEAGTQRQTRSPDVVERRTSSRQRTRALARGLAEREGQELVYSPRQGFRMTRRSQQSGVGGRRGVPVESTGRGEGVGVGSGGEGGRRGRGRDGVVDADESEEGWVLQNELRQLQRETARLLGNSPLRPRRRPPPTSRLPIPDSRGRSSRGVSTFQGTRSRRRRLNTYNDEHVRTRVASSGSSSGSDNRHEGMVMIGDESSLCLQRSSPGSPASNHRRRSPPLTSVVNSRSVSSSRRSSRRMESRRGVSSSMEDDGSEVDGANGAGKKAGDDVENWTPLRERLTRARVRAGERESSLRRARETEIGPATMASATLWPITRSQRMRAGLESRNSASRDTRVAAGLRSDIYLPGQSILARPTATGPAEGRGRNAATPQWGPWMSRRGNSSSRVRDRGRTLSGVLSRSPRSTELPSSRVGGVTTRGGNGARGSQRQRRLGLRNVVEIAPAPQRLTTAGHTIDGTLNGWARAIARQDRHQGGVTTSPHCSETAGAAEERRSSDFNSGHASAVASGCGTGERAGSNVDGADAVKEGGKYSEYNGFAVGSDDEEMPRQEKAEQNSGAATSEGGEGIGFEGRRREGEDDDDGEEVEVEWRVHTFPSSKTRQRTETTRLEGKDDSESKDEDRRLTAPPTHSGSRRQQQRQQQQQQGRNIGTPRSRSHQRPKTEKLGLRERLLRHRDNRSFTDRPSIDNGADPSMARKNGGEEVEESDKFISAAFDSENENDDDTKKGGERGADRVYKRRRGCDREDGGAGMEGSSGVGFLKRFRYTGS